MSTVTVTASAASSAHVHQTTTLILKLKPSLKESLVDSINTLAQILDTYESWEDHLSLRLYEWGARVIEVAPKFNKDTDANLKLKVDEYIHVLMREILLNPLNGLPLKDPILDREWVWEKSMLDEYKTLSLLSPYDAKPINATVHLFAKAMLGWVQSLPYTSECLLKYSASPENASTSTNVTPSMQFSEKVMLLMAYSRMAGVAMECQNHINGTIQLKEAKRLLVQCRRDTEERIREATARAEKNAKEREDEINKNTASLEKSHKTTIAGVEKHYQTELGVASQNNKALQTKFTNSQNVVTQLSNRVATVEDLYKKAQAEVKRLRSEVDNMDSGGCIIS